ncbi:MAG TPA: AAA family ATPase [Chitinophagaceae bacterium]|nr:AAA family ATPase [Chitinophagaceae bacterium]
MTFGHFYFKNFKGIEEITLRLDGNPSSNVYTLVGLNESGKTTILEAINYFTYKVESLDPLNINRYSIEDIHELIPIGKRDNFNDYIVIQASVLLDEKDEEDLKKRALSECNFHLVEPVKKITYTQKYFFQNSKYDKNKSSLSWDYNFKGKKKQGRKIIQLPNDEAQKLNKVIKSNLPSILYFPNFLFDFPDKIFLEEVSVDNKKHEFYRGIIQDILNAMDNSLDLNTHIISRAKSPDKNDKKHLDSVLNKMGDKITEVIFSAWDNIFNRRFSKKQIQVTCDFDELNKPFLEILIKDVDGKYLISERSLGFRWFFVFLLLTQFRVYRKNSKDAFFLFDEPASNLHSTAQSQLLKSFEKLPKVIFTTHSHHLINPKWLESTYVVKNEGLTYNDDDENYNSKLTKITIHKYRDFASKYPSQTNYFQPILDVLDYVPSKLEMTPSVVVLEGKNDFYTIKYFNEIILNRLDLNLMPATGSSNIDTLISLYIGWNANLLVLLDSDKEGVKQKARYLKDFGSILENKVSILSDIDPTWANMTLEDLISEDDRLSIQKESYPSSTSYDKSNFNRAVQELLILKKRINLHKSTVDNFTKLIEFINKIKKA